MTKRSRTPRELAARALCRADGHPENISFEGRPMWMSYLGQVDLVLQVALPAEQFAAIRAEDGADDKAG